VSNIHHPNAFRPQGPIQHDLSKATDTAKRAFDQPVEWRPGEVNCLATTKLRPQTIPGARLFTEIVPASDTIGQKSEMVSMRVLDYKGIDVIAQLDLAPEDVPTLIKRLLQIYKTQGGDPDTLLQKETEET
jgi:hypothetical protein